MAKLIGYVKGDERNRKSSTASRYLTLRGETWEGAIELTLWADGRYEITKGGKHMGETREPVAKGEIAAGDGS